jgi:hypothetical protein
MGRLPTIMIERGPSHAGRPGALRLDESFMAATARSSWCALVCGGAAALLLELLLSAHSSGCWLCEVFELHNDLGYGREGIDLHARGCAQLWFYLGQMPQDEGLLAWVFPSG